MMCNIISTTKGTNRASAHCECIVAVLVTVHVTSRVNEMM